jgi:hypothetical protein
MANSSVSYDPGTPTTDTIRELGPNVFAIDSFRGVGSYTVTLGDRPSCTCPQWMNRCQGTDRQCKHQVALVDFLQAQKAERAARYHELTLKAGTLDDTELARLIEKYRATPGPVLLALLGEEFDRRALEVVTPAPAVEEQPTQTPVETPAPRPLSKGGGTGALVVSADGGPQGEALRR